MSRYLDEHYKGLSRTKALAQFKADAANAEDSLRKFLSGYLRTELLSLLVPKRQGRTPRGVRPSLGAASEPRTEDRRKSRNSRSFFRLEQARRSASKSLSAPLVTAPRL